MAHRLRILLISFALAAWLPGALWAMDAGVVRIESRVGGKTRFGSGFVVRIDGDSAYLATAAHVVEGDAQPEVYFQTRPHRPAKARVLSLEGGDPRGLALLLVDSGLPPDLQALPMAEGAGLDLRGGEPVSALGVPAGLRTWAVITGAVVARRNRSLLFSGGVDEGSSGGPLVKGNAVVGLVMGVERGFGLAVPAMSLKIFLGWNDVPWAAGASKDASVAAASPKPTPPPAPETQKPGETFRDCDNCPEMVVIPAGTFGMGSPEDEEGRDSDEEPVHQVRIANPFALGRQEVTVAEFRAFVDATDYRTEAEKGDGCYGFEDGKWDKDSKRNWRTPGFEQGEDHPVVCVSQKDAQSYIDWLSKETGKTYHLPSEAQWEYAARAGTRTARFWGDDPDAACAYANVHDQTGKRENGFSWTHHACDDGYAKTAPAGSFEANGFGLQDMLGNVWEWTADCWNGSYVGAPDDGSAWSQGDCNRRVLRGGSWLSVPEIVRSAGRGGYLTGIRDDVVGFRPARTL